MAVVAIKQEASYHKQWLHRAQPTGRADYSAAHLPMVQFRQQPDISWMRGLQLDTGRGPNWFVVQAKQEVRFGMNQFGARAKEATAVGMVRMAVSGFSPPYVVNRPFLIVIGRPGKVEVPLFGAYLTPHDWKDPGNLSAL